MNIIRTAKLAVATTIAAAGLLAGANTALADTIYFTANHSTAVIFDASCNNSNHYLTAGIAIAPEPGYGAGQYVHYKLALKDVTSGAGSWTYGTWQGPYVVRNTVSYSGGITYVTLATDLPGFNGPKVAGHRYYVGAIVEWWNPYTRLWEGNSAIVDTSIMQYTASGFYSQTTMCWT